MSLRPCEPGLHVLQVLLVLQVRQVLQRGAAAGGEVCGGGLQPLRAGHQRALAAWLLETGGCHLTNIQTDLLFC